MPFNRNIRHIMALTIVAVGAAAIVTSARQDRSLAQEIPETLEPQYLEMSVSSSTFSSASAGPGSSTSSSASTSSSQSMTSPASSSASPNGEQHADLSTVKESSVAQAGIGDTFTYTLTVYNASTTAGAQNVSIMDALPAGVIFVSAADCAANGQQVICTIGAIDSNTSVMRSITVQVQDDQLLCNTSLVNAAVVTSTYDPDSANNTSEIATPVVCAGQEASAPFCGDQLCNGGETCASCPQDCGICIPAGPVCGDEVCEKGDCRLDCPLPTDGNLPVPPQEMPPLTIEPEVLERIPAQSVDKALNEIAKIIANDRLFEERLRKSEGGDFTAHLLEGDKRTVAKRMSTVIIALREEGNEFRGTANDVLQSPSVSRLLQNLPRQNELHMAAAEGDLHAVLDYLPKPQDLQESLTQLGEYQRILEPHFSDPSARRGSLLLPKAVADETSLPMDAKEGLLESAFLRQRMETLGIDPRTGLPSLDQDIENLMGRKKALAGIIGIMEEDLEKELSSAQGAIDQPTTKSLLNVRGIFLYLRATANFEALEKTYRGAVADMRTGMAKFRSLFSFRRFSPSVEAADLLGEELAVSLGSPDMEEKRGATIKLFELQNPLIGSMLQELPEEERPAHADAFARIREEAGAAKNHAEIQQSMLLFSAALDDLERDARTQRSIFRRTVYLLQDFFGRS